MADIQVHYESSVVASDVESRSAKSKLLDEYNMDSSSRLYKDSILKSENISALGFPAVDLTGFKQEVPYKSSGTLDSVLHAVKHIFIKDETVGDKVEKDVVSHLSKTEREQYDKESAALKKYEDDMRNWGLQATIGAFAPPKAPDCPIHDSVQKRIAQVEKAIVRRARAEMSEPERRELDAQVNEYKQRMKNVEGFQPMPEPGEAIKKFYKRVSDATDSYLSEQSP